MKEHTMQNKLTNRNNWKAIVAYLSEEKTNNVLPKTFEEGMHIWNLNNERPDYKARGHPCLKCGDGNNWIILIGTDLKEFCKFTPVRNYKYLIMSLEPIDHTLRYQVGSCKIINQTEIVYYHDRLIFSKYNIFKATNVNSKSLTILLGSLYLMSRNATNISIQEILEGRQ